MKTLLLVEDDANDRFLFSIAMTRQLSFSLQTVTDGQQAIQYLEGRGEFADRAKYPLPDIIVLNLKMPNVNGFEFLSWRSAFPSASSIPVVVLEGGGNKDDHQQAQKMGAILTYAKPCQLERLCEIVEEICTLTDKGFQQSNGLGIIIPKTETPQSRPRPLK